MTDTLGKVREMAPAISKRSDEIEQARRLPSDLVADLAAAGCFRMLVPRRYGGSEMSLRDAIEVVEEVSRADGSAGWTVMIGASTPVVFGNLPEPTFAALYKDNVDAIGGGAVAPKGQAVVTDGGYLVSGQWPFASGCEHCDWLGVHAVVVRDGEPARLPNGMPAMRIAVFAASEFEVVDTWNVAGLRGTGSHDIKLAGKLCPEEWTCSIFGAPANVDGQIFRVPVVSQLGLFVSAVAVGIGQRALGDIAALAAGGKRPAFGGRRLAESPVFQDRLGELDATLRASRALLYSVIDEAWERAGSGEAFPLLDRARLRSAGPQVVSLAVNVVDGAYRLGGGSSLYDSSPLQRHLRDVHAITQHAAVGRDFFPLVGALLAGEEVDAMRI